MVVRDDNINNISNSKSKSETWYQNENANKNGSNIEKKRYSNFDKEDETKTKKFKVQKEATPEIGLRWNRNEKNSFCKGYRKRS